MHDAPHRPGAARAIPATFGAVLLLGLACGPRAAVAQDGLPRPPCGGMAPFPAYPAAAPAVSRSSGEVVYRMRVLESGADRIVVATENVSTVRLMVVTLFQPGALQAVHILQRLSPTSWGYYGLSRTTQDGSSSLTEGHEASYVNRAAALYRFVAGVPTDRDPPMAR